jgi:glutamate/tyrosine decarboxylase-like PLP-dependent enzyme
MLVTGESGYLAAAEKIMRTARAIRDGIRAIPELAVIGDPTFLVAFKAASDDLDIYLVNDSLVAQGWRMNSLQLPPALHFCVTRPNTADGVAERFLEALRAAVDYATQHRGEPAGTGAMYGFGGTPQGDATINMLMSTVLDAMHGLAPGAGAD